MRTRARTRATRAAALALLVLGCGKDPARLMEEGNAAFEMGLMEAALERYAEVAESHAASFPEVHEKIGDVHAASRRFEQAVKHWRVALEKRPDNPALLNKLGAYLLQTGDDAGARAAFEAAVKADPKESRASFNLGVLELKAGKPDAALGRFEAALAIEPDNASTLRHQGIAYEKLGRREDAARSYLAAFRADPEKAGSADRIFRYLLVAGLWPEAAEVGEVLVASNADPALVASYAYALWRAGDEARGRALYTTLSELKLPAAVRGHVDAALKLGPAELVPPIFQEPAAAAGS